MSILWRLGGMRTPNLAQARARGASTWRRLWDWGTLALAAAFGLRHWLRPGLLASPRLEMIPELSIVWMAKQRILEGGLLSEWSPYEFAGFPLVRYLSYPLYDLLALFSIFTSAPLELLFKIAFILAFVPSGITLYEYAYELTQERAAALIAGLTYALFPFHLHAASEAWVHAVFWAILPLPFLVYERSRKSHPLPMRYALYMGILLGLFPIINSEHTLLAAPFLGLYILLRDGWLLVQTERGQGKRIDGHKALGYVRFWAIAALVAVGLSAFFVLPGVIELRYVGIHLKQGAASFQSAELLRDYAVPPALVLRAIAKRLGLDYSLAKMPVIGSAFWSIAWYPGLVASVLALLGAVSSRHDSKARIILILLGLAAVFAMGGWLPGNPFSRLPFLGRLSAFRAMIFVSFFLSLGTGWGVQALLQWSNRTLSHWRTLAPLRRLRWASLLPATVTVLILLDYAPASAALVTVPSYFPEDEIAAYQWMAAQGVGFRSWEYTTAHRDAYLRSYALQYDGGRHLWGYYDNGAPRHMWALYSWGDLPTALTLGSVRYLITRPGEAGESNRLSQILGPNSHRLASELKQVWDSEHLSIWEILAWQPYVRVYTESALYLGDPEYRALDILPALVAQEVALVSGPSDYLDDYDLTQISLFDRLIAREPWWRDPLHAAETEHALPGRIVKYDEVLNQAAGGGRRGGGFAAHHEQLSEESLDALTWQRVGPERIEIDVRTARPVVLMVSEAWYPNWRLYVDGRPERVWRVNYAFLGARLEPGAHHLVFRYEKPWYVWLGYSVSALTLGLILAYAVLKVMGCQATTSRDIDGGDQGE